MAEYDYEQRPATKEYRENYDKIDWGKKAPEAEEKENDGQTERD